MTRPACVEIRGCEWTKVHSAETAGYIIDCGLTLMPERDLHELPFRFPAAAKIYIASKLSAALTEAVDLLRRGFDPGVCPFEPWFRFTRILGSLDGLRPDHLDFPGKGWMHLQRFDAHKYLVLRPANLRLLLALVVGVLRRRHGPQWNVRLDRLAGLQRHLVAVDAFRRVFDDFLPARCCFEFWFLHCLIAWVVNEPRVNFA